MGAAGKPGEPEAKQRLIETLKPYAADPAKKPHVDQLLNAVQIRKEEFDAVVSTTAAKVNKADGKKDRGGYVAGGQCPGGSGSQSGRGQEKPEPVQINTNTRPHRMERLRPEAVIAVTGALKLAFCQR